MEANTKGLRAIECVIEKKKPLALLPINGTCWKFSVGRENQRLVNGFLGGMLPVSYPDAAGIR